MIRGLIRSALRNAGLTLTVFALLAVWGGWSLARTTVDAIPDISENQVIVMADWPGHSPQDVEDQVTHPLSTALSGVRGVAEVRSLSGFGFSQVYVVFDEPLRLLQRDSIDDFYEARTRVLERLAALEAQLPDGVVPRMGPDATALGQVFWYTVDGPYDLATLRSLQDFVVRYELQALPGVAEVASVGGLPREYQVDVDPDRLRYFGVSILDVVAALRGANRDVGAKTLDEAGSELVLRGLGFLRGVEDIEQTPVGYLTQAGFVPAAGGMGASMAAGPATEGPATEGPAATERFGGHRALLVRDLGRVTLGPAFRRGALADERGEVVGGVVTMQFGANPRDVAAQVRAALARLADPALGVLPEGVRLRPFYDRTALIDETSATLREALSIELLITIAVVLLFLLHVRSSLIVAVCLPLSVLLTFGMMKALGVDSNIMSLTGIAIAIGTMVDMAVIMSESVYAALEERQSRGVNQGVNDGTSVPDEELDELVARAAGEVGPALFTAAATTVISFIPIFFLVGQEGKLFRPLAWTKTLALLSAALTGIVLVPVLCRLFLLGSETGERGRVRTALLALLGALLGGGLFAALLAEPLALRPWVAGASGAVLLGALTLWVLRERMAPIERNPVSRLVHGMYRPTLRWTLEHKLLFLSVPAAIVLAGVVVTFGGRSITGALRRVFGPGVERLRPLVALEERFAGLGTEFMPTLDEGVLLYMPSLLPSASLSQALAVLERQNAAFATVPEVARVVGKVGRAESALDPAPVGMIETFITLVDRDLWRDGLTREDLVAELSRLGHTPGALEGGGAWLQPIETRVVMLNSDVRAPLALKLIGSPRGPDGEALDAMDGVAALERAADELRAWIAEVPGVGAPTVENLGGKRYADVVVDREAAAHYGVSIRDVQDALQVAVGGMVIDRLRQGRESYGLRVAYPRELRNRLSALENVLVSGGGGLQIPLAQVVSVQTSSGPAAIKTEDGRLRLFVTFASTGPAEGSLMREVLSHVAGRRAELERTGGRDPVPQGVALEGAGRYEAELRAKARLSRLVPLCIATIFGLLYLRFRSLSVSLNVFAGVPVTVAGGLLLIAAWPWLQGLMQDLGLWELRSLEPVHITVAVVVGFVALVGIATDDGVVISTFLEQTFAGRRVETVEQVREAVIEAGLRRIRPCLMTTTTTVLALYPVLASTGRGSDVAQPMALPAVGGMLVSLISLFVVPVVYSWMAERRVRRSSPRI